MKTLRFLARAAARTALIAALIGSAGGCGNNGPPSPTGGESATAPASSASPSPALEPSAAPGAAFRLNVAPANLGCDAITVPYRSATIHFAPADPDQVTAVTDAGASLKTYWSVGFVGGTFADPAVLDPEGIVVARDGEIVTIPQGAWPRLNGYFVCPSPDALYVLLIDPA